MLVKWTSDCRLTLILKTIVIFFVRVRELLFDVFCYILFCLREITNLPLMDDILKTTFFKQILILFTLINFVVIFFIQLLLSYTFKKLLNWKILSNYWKRNHTFVIQSQVSVLHVFLVFGCDLCFCFLFVFV